MTVTVPCDGFLVLLTLFHQDIIHPEQVKIKVRIFEKGPRPRSTSSQLIIRRVDAVMMSTFLVLIATAGLRASRAACTISIRPIGRPTAVMTERNGTIRAITIVSVVVIIGRAPRVCTEPISTASRS